MRIKFSEYQQWAKDAASDSLKWHEANNSVNTPKELQAFAEGIRQGYMQAIRDLSARRFIETDINNLRIHDGEKNG